mgnify:CR=1 FL=1
MKGLIHLYCGEGKGKTTAAVGLAVRCAGHGGRVVFGQNAPNGAKATVWLPCAEKKAPVAFGQNVVK